VSQDTLDKLDKEIAGKERELESIKREIRDIEKKMESVYEGLKGYEEKLGILDKKLETFRDISTKRISHSNFPSVF